MQTSAAPAAVVQHPGEQGGAQSTSYANSPPPAEVLTLRLMPRRKKKAVRWSNDVVDNEHMNKKSSKKCCVFHRQRAFGNFSDSDDDELPEDCQGAELQETSQQPRSRG